MSTFKKGKVVILPTNEATGDFSKERIYPCLLKYSWMFDKEEKGKLIFTNSNIKTPTQLQNLYIISDDEISRYDWCINRNNNKVFQVQSEEEAKELNDFIGENGYNKIIATTDNSLTEDRQKAAFVVIGHPLPQPSKQFIQKFVEEYNKGNVITDVLIEYELISNEEYFGNTVNPDNDVPYFDEKLKINPKDNTITIKKVKDCYTQEQVDRMLDEQASRTTAEMLEKFKDYKSKDEVIDLIVRAVSESHDWSNENNNIHSIGLIEKRFLNKWIEENL